MFDLREKLVAEHYDYIKKAVCEGTLLPRDVMTQDVFSMHSGILSNLKKFERETGGVLRSA